MFGIGMPELLMILAIALIVIGPKKLPDLAKSLGRALGEFKRATNDLKDSIQSETGLDDVRSSFKSVGQELKKSVDLDAGNQGTEDTAPKGAEDKASQGAEDTASQETPAPPDPLASVKKAFEGLNQTAAAAAEASAAVAPAEEEAEPGAQPPKPQDTPPE